MLPQCVHSWERTIILYITQIHALLERLINTDVLFDARKSGDFENQVVFSLPLECV
jgi:hypothetical protein